MERRFVAYVWWINLFPTSLRIVGVVSQEIDARSVILA